jgi:hypothetical protein
MGISSPERQIVIFIKVGFHLARLEAEASRG